MLKLTFHVSTTTNLDTETVIAWIMLKLKDNKYSVLHTTKTSVEFGGSSGKLVSNMEAMKRFDGGKFEIAVQDDLTTIRFTYYLSLVTTLIMLAALSVWLFINGAYYAPLLFLSFYVIAISINVITLKGEAQAMLSEIVD